MNIKCIRTDVIYKTIEEIDKYDIYVYVRGGRVNDIDERTDVQYNLKKRMKCMREG